MEKKQGLYPTFQNILFCTDFSENADFAFDYALRLARQQPQGICITVLHVVPESEAQFWNSYMYQNDNVDQKAKTDMDARIERQYKARIPESVKFEMEFRTGKEYQEILNCAKEKNIDLIIIGRHGKGSMQKAFFGNVTEKVSRNASCAVMIIPLTYKKEK